MRNNMKKLLFILLDESKDHQLTQAINDLGLETYLYQNKRFSSSYHERHYLTWSEYSKSYVSGQIKKVYVYDLPKIEDSMQEYTAKFKIWQDNVKNYMASINFSNEYLFLQFEDLFDLELWSENGCNVNRSIPNSGGGFTGGNVLVDLSLLDGDFLIALKKVKTDSSQEWKNQKIKKLLIGGKQSLKEGFEIRKLNDLNDNLLINCNFLQEKLNQKIADLENIKQKWEKTKEVQLENKHLVGLNNLLLMQLKVIQDKTYLALEQKEHLVKFVREEFNVELVAGDELSKNDIRDSVEYRFGKMIVDEFAARNKVGIAKLPFKMYYFVQKNEMPNKMLTTELSDIKAKEIQKHLSYRIGSTLYNVIQEPTNLIKLPVNLISQVIDFKQTKSKKSK